MAQGNYFVSYDLNGQHPTHKEMDDHLKKLGQCTLRVLETVWFVKFHGEQSALYEYVNRILSNNDRVLIITAADCFWRNLLVNDQALQKCWNS